MKRTTCNKIKHKKEPTKHHLTYNYHPFKKKKQTPWLSLTGVRNFDEEGQVNHKLENGSENDRKNTYMMF